MMNYYVDLKDEKKMEKEQKARQLKALFDELILTPLDAYITLLDYLHEEEHPADTVLHREGEVEQNARFLVEGVIGQLLNGKLIRLFFPHQIAFDRNAYMEAVPSKYTLISLTPVKILRLTQAGEERVLYQVPGILDLSAKLKGMARKSDQEWIKLTQLHYTDIYSLLLHKLSKYNLTLKDVQWSGLLGIDARTLSRHKNQLHKYRKSIYYRAMANELFCYPFESKTHDDAMEIDSLTLCWCIKNRLITNTSQRKKFLNQKLSWLSSNLYPEATLKVSVWISGLFTLLFMIDDYTDHLPMGKKRELWYSLRDGFLIIKEDPTHPLIKENKFLLILAERLRELQALAFTGTYQNLLGVFEAYIRENLWEAENRDMDRVPSIPEYLEKRPVFSGGELALQLIPFTLEMEYPEIHRYWPKLATMVRLASKMIYISNDLLSFDKENRINDAHNWVALLILHEGRTETQAKDILIQEHEISLEQFLAHEKAFSAKFNPATRCLFAAIKAIKYQISGSVAWSVLISKRYKVLE
ncbi:terpene synthase family protein [Anditalea andensis]|nr:terpene synthase family protein [Anditalea andensis]